MKKRIHEIDRLYRVLARYEDAYQNCDSMTSRRHFADQARFYRRKLNRLQDGLPPLRPSPAFDAYDPGRFNWLWKRLDTRSIEVLRNAGYEYDLYRDRYILVAPKKLVISK